MIPIPSRPIVLYQIISHRIHPSIFIVRTAVLYCAVLSIHLLVRSIDHIPPHLAASLLWRSMTLNDIHSLIHSVGLWVIGRSMRCVLTGIWMIYLMRTQLYRLGYDSSFEFEFDASACSLFLIMLINQRVQLLVYTHFKAARAAVLVTMHNNG